MAPKFLAGLLAAMPAWCAAAELDGSQLSGWWALPFVGLLLSIALCPLLTPAFWHHHFGKISAAWALAFLLPCAWLFGADTAAGGAMHAFAAEYFPVI